MQCGFGPMGWIGSTQGYYLKLYNPIPDTLRYASMPIATSSTDDPPSAFIDGVLRIPVAISRSLTYGPDGRFSGAAVQTSADLELMNTDGSLDDDFFDRLFRDRPVHLRYGRSTRGPDGREVAPTLKTMSTLFEGYVVNTQFDKDVVRIRVEDGMKRLSRPMQGKTYQGHGGRNGGKDLQGQQPPLAYGYCPNVSPTLVDPLRSIYQVHDGEIKAITAVYDRASPLLKVKDVKTYDELEALVTQGELGPYDIGPGQYATCLNEGFFRIGGLPSGVVTADIEGDGINDGFIPWDSNVLFDKGVGFAPVGSQTHNKYAGGMIFRILTTRGRFLVTEVDIDRLDQFDSEYPYELGVFIPSGQEVSVGQVCQLIADSVCAVITRNQYGQVTLAPLNGPARGSVASITPTEIARDSLELLALPYGAFWSAIRVSYGRNNTLMKEDQISIDADDFTRQFVSRSTSYYEYFDTALTVLIPDRPVLIVESLLRFERDAREIGRRLQVAYPKQAIMIRVGVKGFNFRLSHLETVMITHPRFGLANGRLMQIVGIDERPLEYTTELTLFG